MACCLLASQMCSPWNYNIVVFFYFNDKGWKLHYGVMVDECSLCKTGKKREEDGREQGHSIHVLGLLKD